MLHNTGTVVDEGGDGFRPGTVLRIQDGGGLTIKLDKLKLDKGTLPAEDVPVPGLKPWTTRPLCSSAA